MQRPNVLLIIADDLGWRDLGCCGSSFYETPHLDRLAHEGVRFTDAYAAAPVCSPTRASIMSGRTPAAVGITNYIAGQAKGRVVEPSYQHELPADERTIAEALGEHGYHSTYVGKWHLGGEKHAALPTDRGFDENIAGCSWGSPVNGYFAPWEIPTLDESDVKEGDYLPDHLGRAAAAAVTERDDEPFFLCYAPYLVHTPLQAPEDDVERYERKRLSLGLDAVDDLEIGGTFPCAHKRDRRIKRRIVQSHPTYAAMVEAFDRNVGRVLDALDAEGIADETIVIVTSDNGGLATAEGSPTTNRPLAEGKGWMDEGGNRVPLIVRVPGGIEHANTPGLIETPVISYDLFPTILRAAGGEPAADVEGVDLAPAISGEAIDRDPLVWHYPHYGNQGGTPSGAIRDGPWKLIEYYETDAVRLYHLGEDVRERHDLSDHCPERAANLRTLLDDWRDRVNADMPAPDPDFETWPDRAEPPSTRR